MVPIEEIAWVQSEEIAQLLNHTRVVSGFGPLEHDVVIEEESHRLAGRSRSLERDTLMPEPLSGDTLKKSASDPLRFVICSHSSASTTTAVRRPLRVMVCGPCARALSMTALNFAFARVTV